MRDDALRGENNFSVVADSVAVVVVEDGLPDGTAEAGDGRTEKNVMPAMIKISALHNSSFSAWVRL